MNGSAAPQSLGEFQEKLVKLSGTLPKRLRQCADYVATNMDRVAVSTVAELAAGAKVQPSAFIRFCQLMGFSGYSEMQAMFREQYNLYRPDYGTRLKNLQAQGDDSPATLLAEFVEAGRASLENLTSQVNPETLTLAVDALAQARVIHIAGLSRAYPVAAYFAYAFEKMDIPTILHDKTGNLNQRHSMLEGDVLLAISFTPYTSEIIELASFAHDRGVRVVAITDALNSPFHELGATALTVSEVDVGAFRALSATLSLAISLAVAVGTRHGSGNIRK
ncbi:MAG TPA: MurR/RpiR family transcriptional regulator [Aliiroseovarius sp.]|nr:MurR/RpiR family transcriptional regulator [Aliiroseovarius sp.]